MKILTVLRLLTLSFLTFLPTLSSFWSLTIFRNIFLNNFEVKEPSMISTYASYYLTSFLFGSILGSFFWPIMIHYILKKDCLLIGLIVQGIMCFIQGFYYNIFWLIGCRFIAGCFNNIFTVGRDFLFEVSENRKYRIFGFSMKSVFTLCGNYFGPWLGYHIYFSTGLNFDHSSKIISFFFIFATIIFIFLFNILPHDPNLDPKTREEEEENMILMTEYSQEEDHLDQIRRSIKICFRKKDIRGWVLIYMIFNSVSKTNLLISILFLEEPLSVGMNISPKDMANITFFGFFPSIVLIFFSPFIVNNFISDKNFIKLVVFIYIILTITLPILKDLFKIISYQKYQWIVYVVELCILCSSSSLISPYFYYFVIKKTPLKYRTSVNSAIFYTMTFINSILVIVGCHLYSLTMHSPFFEKFAPFNKYILFGIFALFNLFGFFSLK